MMASHSNETNNSLFSNVLTPGSSLNPTFLAILDGAFVFLALTLLVLAFLTSGNIHIFVLLGIELALWASVKWFVLELKRTSLVTDSEGSQKESKKIS